MMQGSTQTRKRSTRAICLVAGLALLATGCVVQATWTPQSVEPAKPASPDQVFLTDVACPAAGACVAIGSLATVITEPIVLRQQGSSWTRVSIPFPLNAVSGVSCRGVDDCLVGGSPTDMHLGPDGLTAVPRPQGASDIAAISCVAGGCLRLDASSSSQWNGTSWNAPVATPATLLPLHLLSCTSTTSCLAIGNDFGIEGFPSPGKVTSSVWDGTSWSSPVTLDHDTRILDLSCASPTACFATAGVRAGTDGSGVTPPAPEVLRWDGTAWSTVSIPFPGPAPTEPGYVSCDSATSCTVLWVAGRSNPVSPSYLARWNGTSWTVESTDASATDGSLGCTSASSCVAVGGSTAQQLSGSTWSTMSIPTSVFPSEQLSHVSCTSPSACTAVGVTVPVTLPVSAIVRRFDGSTWSAQTAGASQADDISCGGPKSCMTATGTFGSFSSRHWDGNAWQDLPTVVDSNLQGVRGLSCATATWCLLTTFNFDDSAHGWVWSGGTTWSPLPTLPQNSGPPSAVSCSAPEACVVATDFIGPELYRLSGTTWTALPLTGLDVTNLGSINDVSCTTAEDCVVVGSKGYEPNTSVPIGLLGVLHNGVWQSTLRPGNSYSAVDCWSSDGCAAVGASGVANAPAVDVLRGSAWSPVQSPHGLSSLSDISCGGALTCEVTGGYVDEPSRATVAKLEISG